MIPMAPRIWATKKLLEVGPVEVWIKGEEIVAGCKPKPDGFYLRFRDLPTDKTHFVPLTLDEGFTLGTALIAWSERIQKEREAARGS